MQAIHVICFIMNIEHWEATSHTLHTPWWRHQMETVSALLAICAGNSPVPGEFPAQRPVTRGFDVFFDMRPDKRLSNQSWCWWFETASQSLWRHSNAMKFLWQLWHSTCVCRTLPWPYLQYLVKIFNDRHLCLLNLNKNTMMLNHLKAFQKWTTANGRLLCRSYNVLNTILKICFKSGMEVCWQKSMMAWFIYMRHSGSMG